MKNIIAFLSLFICLTGMFAQNQGISINNSGADPDSSAILDIQSTDKGLLIPRMDSSQRVAINPVAQGLMVFDITTQSFWFYSGVE